MKKKCNTCKIKKSLDNFSKCKNHKDGKSYKCKCCAKEYDKQYHIDNAEYAIQWRINNPADNTEYNKIFNNSEGVGVYTVYLDKQCLYVGQGQIKQRKVKHLKLPFHPKNNESAVAKYCIERNINRKLLSFNVLQLVDDTPHRKKLELHYRRELTPLLNPYPPIALDK